MAVKTKTQLQTDITADPTFTSAQKTILDDMVDSYEDVFAQMDTATRDAIATPGNGQIIYNTDNSRYEYWNGSAWFGIGQDLSTPMEVKVDLSSADILALDVTSIQVAPAPGAGYAAVPISYKYRYTFGSTQYSGTGSANVYLKSASKTTADGYTNISKLVMEAAANRSGSLPANTGTGIDAIVENDALELKAGGNLAAGDGTLTVWVTYSIITY